MACWGAVVSRRKNHGRAIAVGELADRALRSVVPAYRLRVLRVQLGWVDALPASLRDIAAPVAFDGDTLLLHVLDNQWLHELTYLRADILARLRRACPQTQIGGLRLRVGELPAPPPPARADPTVRLPALAAQPSSSTLDAIAAIEDAGLRHAIATARQALTRIGRDS